MVGLRGKCWEGSCSQAACGPLLHRSGRCSSPPEPGRITLSSKTPGLSLRSVTHSSLCSFPPRERASAETCLEPHRVPPGPSVPGPPARTSWPVATRNSAWSASTSASGWAGVSPFPKSPQNSAAGPLPVITLATPSAMATVTSAFSSSRCTAKANR